MELEANNRRLQHMLYQHAMWMVHHRARTMMDQLARQMARHHAQQLVRQRIRQMICPRPQPPLSHRQSNRQVHWNPHLMHKLPSFYHHILLPCLHESNLHVFAKLRITSRVEPPMPVSEVVRLGGIAHYILTFNYDDICWDDFMNGYDGKCFWVKNLG